MLSDWHRWTSFEFVLSCQEGVHVESKTPQKLVCACSEAKRPTSAPLPPAKRRGALMVWLTGETGLALDECYMFLAGHGIMALYSINGESYVVLVGWLSHVSGAIARRS